ncbi:uncharacterized protein LOC114528287 isoform X2 [Dendronephthya gigantea]|uniref:uncharacterized protein LOC114528287 isoform X2 n=1 Tax=Dendronephthya gigantea TaxID=151771 RepID=UPI001069C9C5|nr:uncharacterized protein LOC114528287 isoform X2 [Dendronephthya gigantea]
MAVKTSNSAPSTVLLRRPLPPKLSEHQNNSLVSKFNTKGLEKKREKLRKNECLALCSKENTITSAVDLTKQAYNFNPTLVSYKPRGPDPLPGRQPKRFKDNPYDFPVDGRFLPSLPQFTLEQFVQQCNSQQNKSKNELKARQFIGRSDDSWFLKKNNQLNSQQELYKQVIDAENAKLPKLPARKPQRQIIFELAAAILTSEESDLDERITEILDEVEIINSNTPSWFQRQAGPDLPGNIGTMTDTVRELSELSSLDSRAAPDIAHILNRHLDQNQAIIESKRESWPQSEILLSGSPTSFFQGTARCSSPFQNNESQHETMLTAAEFVILETIVKCYTTLDLKAHFIAHLPNIAPLCTKLTVVNLSFNNFLVVPSQLLTIKNLVNLNLRNNPIKELPTEIGQLRLLQTLVVSFCLVSCIPVSLFSLKHLKVLDLSYNRLSFLPKEIGNLRSLRELSVEGNELGAFPSGILQLKLKHLRMMCNFTHPVFWRETTSNQPQRLFHMAAQRMISSERYCITSIPQEIKMLLFSPGICDCCDGPVFGPGVRIIKTVEEIFGVKNMAIIFTVCTHTCRRAFKKNSNAVVNWMNKNCSQEETSGPEYRIQIIQKNKLE